MNTIPEFDGNSFDIEDAGDVLGMAKSLLDGMHPGILCTVDRSGTPQARWLSTLSFDEFPVFHTLSAPGSRKVEQINHHPEVSWMFFNRDLTLILNLFGKARVLTGTAELKRIWAMIEDKSHAYFLNQYSKAPGFVVIETTVDSIECTSPKNALRFQVPPGDWQRSPVPVKTERPFTALPVHRVKPGV